MDWLAELRRQERSILWLVRQTGWGRTSVYLYAWGCRKAPAAFIAKASKALGMADQ